MNNLFEDITWITSCNENMYRNKIYGKCLDSWINLPGKKILFSEDNFQHPNFINKKLDYKKQFGKRVMRFYSKALSIYTSLCVCDTKFLVWLDSDIEVKKLLDFFPATTKSIASMFYPFPKNVADSLPVANHDFGADTGIIIFNFEKLKSNFKEEYIDYWNSEKIFNLEAPKDTWVLCDMLPNYDYENLIKEYREYPVGSNYFEFTDFKNYFIHYIGKNQK